MSWNVQAVGKPKGVDVKLVKEFATAPCQEPEESIRQAVGKALHILLEGSDSATVLEVSASGSQSSTYKDGKYGPPFIHNLAVSVSPLYGFVDDPSADPLPGG